MRLSAYHSRRSREQPMGIQTLRQPALVEFGFPVGAFPFYPASAQF
jgi:hypothetical protein